VNGTEMMLKSMGLGGIIDAAKTMMENGTIQKIVAFADGLEVMQNERNRDRALLYAIAGRAGITPDTHPGLFTNERRLGGGGQSGMVEPGTDTGGGRNPDAGNHDDNASSPDNGTSGDLARTG